MRRGQARVWLPARAGLAPAVALSGAEGSASGSRTADFSSRSTTLERTWLTRGSLNAVLTGTQALLRLLRTQRQRDAAAGLDTQGFISGYQAPPDGLHNRWPDLPSLQIEQRAHAKLDAVLAFARVNTIDREIVASAHATVGILSAGKAHFDLLAVLRRLDIPLQALADAGVRVHKLGLVSPIEPGGIARFVLGLREVLVVEEKGPVVEIQLRAPLYNAPAGARPVILGKHDAAGLPLLSVLGELRPSRLIEVLADWLARHFPGAAPAAPDAGRDRADF